MGLMTPKSKRNAAPGEAPPDQIPENAQARCLCCAASAIGVGPLDFIEEDIAGIDQEIVHLDLEPAPESVAAFRQVSSAQINAQAEEEMDGGVGTHEQVPSHP